MDEWRTPLEYAFSLVEFSYASGRQDGRGSGMPLRFRRRWILRTFKRHFEDKGRRPGNHQTPVSVVASFVGQVGEEDTVDIAIPRLSLPFSSGDGSVRSGRLNELS